MMLRQFLKYAGYLLIIAIAGYLIYRFYFIGIWILVAAVLSFFGQLIAGFIDRLHIGSFRIPHAFSSLLALFVIVLVIFGFMAIFVPLLVNQAATIAEIDMDQLTSNLEQPFMKIDSQLHSLGVIPKDQTLQTFIISSAKSFVGMGNIGAAIGSIVSSVGSIFVGLFSIFFISFFFIKDENMFENNMLLFVPEKHHPATHQIISDSKFLLKRYFIGVLVEVVGVMSLIALGLWVLGIENPLLIGFFGGVMNIIPYLGPVLGSVIGLVLAVTSALAGGNFDDIGKVVIKFGAVFVIVQFIDNNILVPFIYAKSVKSHPLEIFLVIVMGGSLAGFVGMLVAVPVYTVLRIIAKEFLQQFRVVQKITETMDK